MGKARRRNNTTIFIHCNVINHSIMHNVTSAIASLAFQENELSDVTITAMYRDRGLMFNCNANYYDGDDRGTKVAVFMYLNCVPIHSNEIKRFHYKLPK